MCVFGHLHVFFGKMSIQVFCLFLIEFFFFIELYEFFIQMWILTSYQIYYLQMSSPIQ